MADSVGTSTLTIQSDAQLIKNGRKSRSLCFPSLFGYHRVTVEPVLLLASFAISSSQAVLTQLLLVRSCEVTLGIDPRTCHQLVEKTNLTEAQRLEEIVQPPTANVLMAKMVMEATIPALLSLFLGPWSDKYGRKLLMVWPLLGYTATFWATAVMSMIPTLPPYYYMLASLPLVLSGGILSVIASTFSFMTDITTVEQRSLRMGLLDASSYCGYVVGVFVSAPLFRSSGEYGYIAVFATCGALCLIASLYVMIFIQESVKEIKGSACRNLPRVFNWRLLVTTLYTSFRKRENNARSIFLITMVVMATSLFTFDGEISVLFLFARKKFGWSISEYAAFFGVTVLVIVLGTVIGFTVISSWMKVSDTSFSIFSLVTKVFSSLIYVFVPEGWMLYIGSVVRFFGGVTTPLCRSIISKTVPKEVVCTVFSLTSAVEALMPVAAVPMYMFVYKATFLTNPGAFFLLSAAIFAVAIVLMSIIIYLQQISPPRESEEQPKIQ